MRELHACELHAEQTLEICRFLADGECQLLANITDTEIVTRAAIFRLRLEQAWLLRRNFDWYRARGGSSLAWERDFSRRIKQAGLASQISDGEYLQVHYLVFLISDALAKSLTAYPGDEWRGEFEQMSFIIDRKLPGKLSTAEKYLQAVLLPALGSRGRRGAMRVPPHWRKDPVHPFIAKYAQQGGRICGRYVRDALSLNSIFARGLTFGSSHVHAGLQLADVVANVVRRAVSRPADPQAQAAFEELRDKLRCADGRYLDPRAVAPNVPVPQGRYRHFVRDTPRASSRISPDAGDEEAAE